MSQTLSEAIAVRLTMTQALIDRYAELTQDFNPIHVDPEFARRSPMGGVIAHGTLSLSLLWQWLELRFGTAALSSLTVDVRFVAPVRPGEHLVAAGEPMPDPAVGYRVWVKDETSGQDRIVGVVTPADDVAARILQHALPAEQPFNAGRPV